MASDEETVGAMTDDPSHIADWLVQEHGLEGAYEAALEGALEAQREGDNYRLSVWREVKAVLAAGETIDPVKTR